MWPGFLLDEQGDREQRIQGAKLYYTQCVNTLEGGY